MQGHWKFPEGIGGGGAGGGRGWVKNESLKGKYEAKLKFLWV